MGIIAYILAYIMTVVPVDVNERRRHVHIYGAFRKHTRQHCLAKIWIEKNGEKDISVAYNNGIPPKKLEQIMDFIDRNYDSINRQIDNTFSGKRTTIIKDK